MLSTNVYLVTEIKNYFHDICVQLFSSTAIVSFHYNFFDFKCVAKSVVFTWFFTM